MSHTLLGFIVIMLVSTGIAWFLSRKKPLEKPVKIMLFVLYFWVSVFTHIIVVAGLYYFNILN